MLVEGMGAQTPMRQLHANTVAIYNKYKHMNILTVGLVAYPFLTQDQYIDSNPEHVSPSEYTITATDLASREQLEYKLLLAERLRRETFKKAGVVSGEDFVTIRRRSEA